MLLSIYAKLMTENHTNTVVLDSEDTDMFTTKYHNDDVIMTKIASQITSLAIVYSTIYTDVDQRKHQNSASLAFVWGIFPAQMASNAENVSIWWRHHARRLTDYMQANVHQVLCHAPRRCCLCDHTPPCDNRKWVHIGALWSWEYNVHAETDGRSWGRRTLGMSGWVWSHCWYESLPFRLWAGRASKWLKIKARREQSTSLLIMTQRAATVNGQTISHIASSISLCWRRMGNADLCTTRCHP